MTESYNAMIQEIMGEGGELSKRKENYIPRESQIKAAHKVYDVIRGGNIMLMEGPCGFGKTFAYLIPAAVALHEKQANRVVIVTNGIALSEQLMYQDLPVIASLMKGVADSDTIKFALLKGKSNFVCLRKFKDVHDFDDKAVNATLDGEIVRWVRKTSAGDFSELTKKIEYSVQSQISCTSEGECLGMACPERKTCFYSRHKAKAAEANIVISNYHILYSDWKIGNRLLGEYDCLIMDEAHESAGIFRDFAMDEHSASQLVWAKNKLSKMLHSDEYEHIDVKTNKGGEFAFQETLDILIDNMRSMEIGMEPQFGKYDSFLLLSPTASIVNEDAVVKAGVACSEVLQELLSTVEDLTEEAVSLGDADSSASLTVLSLQISKIIEKASGVVQFFHERVVPELHKKYVYYLEKSDTQTKLCKKYIHVSEVMSSSFFSGDSAPRSVILTSATMSIGGHFKYIKRELGLDLISKEDEDDTLSVPEEYIRHVEEFIGESPFDLEKQQLWFLPNKAVNGNAKEHGDSLYNVVNEIVDAVGGGILFLCTSVRNMNLVYEIVNSNDTVFANDITVLKQGKMPNKQLAEMFRTDTDSILVATRSFFTGIDIPGDSLRCVVIDKLPFPSPGEPVMAVLNKEEGSFHKYSIPMMIMTLKQAIGRGVRSIDDKCIIAFMDRRIHTGNYVKSIVKTFNYKITTTKDALDLRDFLKK